jgi:ribonuclease HII
VSRTVNATLLPELQLAAQTGSRYIAGIDEVGRGALAGPVTVGVVVIDLHMLPPAVKSSGTGVWQPLDGVRDSKLLSAAARKQWQPSICEHAEAYSVQHSTPQTIDAAGLSAALGAAGRAALSAVHEQLSRTVDHVILDGVHDWLHAEVPVRTMPKADTQALSVACASVLAKVKRDSLMTELAEQHPAFGWDSNKGYGSAAHRAAIRAQGPTEHHRRSWNLGLEPLPGL